MKFVPVALAGLALAALSGAAAARDNVSFSISFGVPAAVHMAPAPVYVPAPTYYPPPPAYFPPPTVYYAPAPVYAPVIVRAAPSAYFVQQGHAFGHRHGHGHGHRHAHWR